jgi:uncharacterized membrane protein
MSAETEILVWWLLFAGTHILGSAVPVRTFLIRAITLSGFKALYSLVALATFVPLCWTFAANKHAGALLFVPTSYSYYMAHALMLLALVVLLQGLATVSPLTTTAEMTGRYGSGARGIQRVTRHPQNLAFMLFGLAHCLTNPYVGDWIFFGGFIGYGLVSAMHQDRRVLLLGPEEAKRLIAETSLVPFAAIIAGKLRLAPRENSLLALLAAVVMFILLRQFHGPLFGAYLR